jgi:sarcosine oxidase subunit gamma
MTYPRMSPLHLHVASRTGDDEGAGLSAVALADFSHLSKCGLKGPDAMQWLRDNGIEPPAEANRWLPMASGGVIARLGRSEFFIEDGAGGSHVSNIRTALGTGTSGVYPVIRQDAGIALTGARVNELLLQTCNVNFAALETGTRVAVMTQMIGVSVLAIRVADEPLPRYRIWCDPTFAPYFWETLTEIAAELGGGVMDAVSA